MQLTFLGSTSQNGGSPTLFKTSRATFIVQGYRITDPEALSQMNIPEHETVVEVPTDLLYQFLPPGEKQR